jgi:hypothetical protein
VDLLPSTIVLLSVEGVVCIVMRRRPGIGLACWLKAVHCLGWFDRRCKPRRASSRIFAQTSQLCRLGKAEARSLENSSLVLMPRSNDVKLSKEVWRQ